MDLALPAEGVAVVGDNGQGKTNLLEAMAYLHLMRSVRGARDRDVVRFGAAGFHVRGTATVMPEHGAAADRGASGRSAAVGFERSTRRKRVTVDGVAPERLSDGLGAVPSVTFSPADVELVRGNPAGRRRYLDVTLATTSPRYLGALQTYRAALRQRNTALRALARRAAPTALAVESALGPWEPLLAEAGAVLWTERAAWTARWAPELARVCGAIGELETVHVRHLARLPGASAGVGVAADASALARVLAVALDTGRAGDLRHGSTRIGPHRDDLILTLGGRDLRVYGSAGQQRTAAIGLRILEADTLRDRAGAGPVLLFDDPFAELDERRARAILDVLGGAGVGQVVLAVPRTADIPRELTRLERYTIADGMIAAPGRAA